MCSQGDGFNRHVINGPERLTDILSEITVAYTVTALYLADSNICSQGQSCCNLTPEIAHLHPHEILVLKAEMDIGGLKHRQATSSSPRLLSEQTEQPKDSIRILESAYSPKLTDFSPRGPRPLQLVTRDRRASGLHNI
jgi:hypothetical protein